MTEEKNYNPLEKKHIGESVVRALMEEPVQSLGLIEPFDGVGVYVIYYVGEFPAYKAVAAANSDKEFKQPIYVGKAVPKGARKGIETQIDQELYKRLSEHGESIKQSDSLEIADFFCRYLTVDDIWIPLGESLLIEMYKPVWNVLLDGFGNHDPGSGRYKQMRSRWDVLHPGRSWANRCKPRQETQNDLITLTRKYLAGTNK
ncbi:Eco29kI family restriction endonuclease [Patescibacteria group bacterium]|nr:MAG: Eco29kI family restriction endonuclease [Patescibacteria group bacterium]